MTSWIVVCQAPLSMQFPRQEYWSGLPCPTPENLPYQGIEPGSPALQADSLPTELSGPTRVLCPWNSLGKNTGVGCHFLLQGVFPTEGSNLGLLHCRQSLYHLSHQGSPLHTGEPVPEQRAPGKCSVPRPGSPVPSTPERREGLRACYWELSPQD